MNKKVLASLLRVGSVVVMVFAFGLMAYVSWNGYRRDGSLNALGLVAVNAIFVTLFVIRRDATEVATSPWIWLLACAGTVTPLLLRPAGSHAAAVIGSTTQLVGTFCVIASLLSLQRSLGIVPANRGIRTQGLYHIVRHPLYASELLTILGFTIANPTFVNISLVIVNGALQFGRAYAEENLLGEDAAYVEYRSRVKFRLIPGIL